MGLKNMKSRKMKGSSTLILLAIGLVIVLMIVVTMLNIPFLKSANQVEKDLEVRSEIHTMGNALDAAKLYMETSLEYSIYQACYDNLKNGGWDTLEGKPTDRGYALWNYPDPHPDVYEFKAGLENSIKANLGLYSGTKAYTFLSDYQVNLPTYSDIVVSTDDTDPRWMFVSAFADSNLNIEKTQESGERIRLEKESTIQNDDEYKVNCYGIYQKGMDVYAAESGIIQTYIESISVDPKDKDAEINSFPKNIKRQLLSTWGNEPLVTWKEDDYLVSAQVLKADLTQLSVSDSVTYNADVKVKFEVWNETGNQFPVYDGSNVAFQPMKLVFVLSIQEKWPQGQTAGFKKLSVPKSTVKNSLEGYSYQEVQGGCDPENFVYYTVRADEEGYVDDYEQCPEEDPCCLDVVNALKEMGFTVTDEIQSTSQPGISFAQNIQTYTACTEPDVPPKGTEKLQEIVLNYAKQNQLPEDTVMSIVQRESTWDPAAISPMGAIGLFQLTEETADWLGWKISEGKLTDPAISAKYGTKYYKYILDNVNPDERLALSAFNAGHNRIKNRLTLPFFCQKTPTFDCIKKYLTRETLTYVRDITTKCKPRYTQYLSQSPFGQSNA
jgi:soluble lytic murein transglycosylase